MMKLRSFIYIFTLSFFANQRLLAQEDRFFMAQEFKKAYEKHTRGWDGKPGPNYWQNTVDYIINIELDPYTRLITGNEKIVYHNNSPDILNSIILRLYYDVYGKGKGRDDDLYTHMDLTDGVKITRLVVDQEEYEIDGRMVDRSGTNMEISLNNPLPAGKSLTMEVDWANYIPYSSHRTGRYDTTSHFVAYFYPQVSVYDDIFGWDNLDYGGITEFYNNLANFDITISVPPSFTVWATGELANARNVLNKKIYKRFIEAKESAEVIHVLTKDDLDDNISHSGEGWHFIASQVSDFAFGLSDHFVWDAAMQKVDGREVLINSVFPVAMADQCQQLTAMQQKCMKHYSEDIPGVPYPYPVFTTFIGGHGGGMEFPMMANNSGPGRGVTVHEMFHTYMPMYVRTNERKFAWIDEGWATLITETVINTYFDNKPDTGIVYKTTLFGIPGSFNDLPLITSSQFHDRSNYGYSAYQLPAFVYGILHQVMGPDTFHACFKEFILRWAGKSPTPYDFFYTFENVSGEDLGWIWEPWFFEFGYPDLKIVDLKEGKLTIENTGTKPLPISVKIKYENDTKEEIELSASIWKESRRHAVIIPNADKIRNIFINQDLPDINPIDNVYPSIIDMYKSVIMDKSLEGFYSTSGRNPLYLNLEYRKGVLVLNSRWTRDAYLIPEDQDTYSSIDENIKIQFIKENNVVTGMTIRVWGRDMMADKL